jgi:hypothetical protein
MVEQHATALWYGLGCGDELSSHALPGLWVNSEIPATGVGGWFRSFPGAMQLTRIPATGSGWMVQIFSRNDALWTPEVADDAIGN